jgi:hypothetical protein
VSWILDQIPRDQMRCARCHFVGCSGLACQLRGSGLTGTASPQPLAPTSKAAAESPSRDTIDRLLKIAETAQTPQPIRLEALRVLEAALKAAGG